MQCFFPSPARRNQKCDFHFVGMCFSFRILRADQQSSEYLQISLIQHLWSIQLSIPFVWHVLDAKCLPPHQAVPELPTSPYIHNRSCDIPICRRTFPLSSSLPVPQAELQGLSEAKLVQTQSLWRVFASGGTNDFEPEGQAQGGRTLCLCSRLASLRKHLA